MDYEETLTQAYEGFHTKKNIPELFCIFVKNRPSDTQTPAIEKQVQTLLQQVIKRIGEYDEQFQILVNELGVLCRHDEDTQETVTKFFQSYLDLLRLIYSVYEEDPEKLKTFFPIVQQLNTLFATRKLQPIQDPLTNALLLELTKSAWAFTKTQKDMNMYAKQVGGRYKNKTRKQHKHTHKHKHV